MFTLPDRTVIPSSPRVASPSFVAGLQDHGDAPAVVGRLTLRYDELADRVAAAADRLASDHRRLVLVPVRNDIASLVAYLGSLASGHAVLLTSADDERATSTIRAAYSPDATISAEGGGHEIAIEVAPSDGGHELHPDLTLLLSTSGSTGSPKLVRLSRTNLEANAAQIASYLDVRPTDRAALTLPMHYCYGLSIVHSNLLRGAALFIDDRSVVDRCFWDEFARCGATSVSGVPYTFELLDRVGFADLELPALRYVTQAGGRLAPQTVERYARLGARRGWDFFVMYGQTEASARMAYLPPHLAATHPSAIGVPVPGGELRIDDGELVYRGPNVMLGYASSPADLARGREVVELRTGDLAEQDHDGLFRIIGRVSRFIKPFGLRVDLDRVEAALQENGVRAACAGDDRRLVVATPGGPPQGLDSIADIVQRTVPLPRAAIEVVAVDDLPRLANGKIDYHALLAAAPPIGSLPRGEPIATRPVAADGVAAIRATFGRVLGLREVRDDQSFVDLGGDSLSYIEMSIALEERVPALPLAWPTMSIAELAELAEVVGRTGDPTAATCPVPPSARRRVHTRAVETNVLLRAVAIVAIVGSHTAFMNVRGGAHVLLAVAGFNTARFHLARAATSARAALAGLASGTARIAVPAAAWIAAWVAFTDHYSLANVLFANSLVGPSRWGERWQYWFLEALLHILAGLAAFVCVPPLRRLLVRHRFGVATAFTVAGLALRYDALGIASTERLIHRADSVFWFFALGWAAQAATSTRQRVLLTALLAAGIPHYFESGRRESYVTLGMLALIWVARVRLPARLLPVVRVLAASSLYVYLTHWELYPAVAGATDPFIALVASLVAGAATWWIVERVTALARAAAAAAGAGSRVAGRTL